MEEPQLVVPSDANTSYRTINKIIRNSLIGHRRHDEDMGTPG